MNKIIVVGHPQSGHEQVLGLLTANGVAPALPSRRDGLTPQQIGAILIKAHGAVPADQVQSAAQLPQLRVAPLWQGMALDLMLGNLDQALWGWADTQAIQLLDYWTEQDPRIVFVLVYDSPETAYLRLPLEQAGASPEGLQRHLDAWVAYNAALLHFHLRHPKRSLLVHASRAQSSAQSWVSQLGARIEVSLQLPATADAMTVPGATAGPQMDGPQIIAAEPASTGPVNAQLQFLAGLIVEQHPEAQALYEELQAAATLPSDARLVTDPSSEDTGASAVQAWVGPHARYLAWQACVAQLQETRDLARRASAQSEHVERLLQQLDAGNQEGALLLSQLHQVQGELERHHLEGRQQAEELQTVKKAAQTVREQLKNAQEELGRQQQEGKQRAEELQTLKMAAQTTRDQLKKAQDESSTTKNQPASAELQQENDLLLTQLHQVQEELEHYYLENKKLKSGIQAKPKPIYGAADRIKQQLSYRLGATMIARSGSLGGWLGMPLALRAEVKRFRHDQAARQGQKLPPIARYADAHEAERVKQHLSYRLGATMVARSASLGGWISMPWALYAQARDFKKNRSPAGTRRTT